ncbi:MAG: HPr(Ser) kinase/phosphatase [Balneolaceae bacterium]
MPFGENEPIPKKENITVSYLIEKLQSKVKIKLEACTAESQCKHKQVTEADLHRPGLALAGYIKLFSYQRIQIIGNTETKYLEDLSEDDQKRAFGNLVQFDIPVIFLTDNNKLPTYLLEMANHAGIPVFSTNEETTLFMYILRDFLEDQFAVQTMVHGTMVDVYGIGILIAGKSGIGKSEVALDLVERGHRLVADDVVMLSKKSTVLIASATDMNEHFMEIRGLGIINIMSMFGIRSIRYQKRLEVVMNLHLWEDSKNVDRTGLDHESVQILKTNIPLIHLPITPGKNITVIAEVIAMNYLLENYGYDAAKAFQEKVKRHIAHKKENSDMPRRAVEYFEGDFE